MDCCNYMQHRQSYYGSHYYENAPTYPEYHQQQYNNNIPHYAGQNWAFAPSACSDYVYNPKEARLRKAMRERERSMGAAQMGTQRARRSPHWPKPNHHMPPSHGEHLGPLSKDVRTGLRHEMQHGFLNENGAGAFVYQPQQYQFTPHNDYTAYIQVPSGWMPNGYLQGNTLAQQHIWNQYQSDRLRHQQTPGPSYMMNHHDQQPSPSYHHHQQQQQQMQSNQVLQMQASQKTNIHQNVETPPSTSTVERFLNINTPGPSSVSTMSEEHSSSMTMVNSPTSSSTLTASETMNSSEANNSENNISGMSDMVHQILEPTSSSASTAELGNGNPSAGEVDVSLNLGVVAENSESSFSGMQLFEEENLPAINAQDLHKSLNATLMTATSRAESKNSNPLPDFNQAFGSTERGRFQSPPDPRMGPDKEYLEFYNSNYNLKSEQFSKWPEMTDTYTGENFNNISF